MISWLSGREPIFKGATRLLRRTRSAAARGLDQELWVERLGQEVKGACAMAWAATSAVAVRRIRSTSTSSPWFDLSWRISSSAIDARHHQVGQDDGDRWPHAQEVLGAGEGDDLHPGTAEHRRSDLASARVIFH